MTPDAPQASKFCPYCMAPHYQRGRACCPKHARRLSSRLGAETQGRNRAARRILEQADERWVSRRRWRDIAFGRNAAERLREIFGVDVDEGHSAGREMPVPQ